MRLGKRIWLALLLGASVIANAAPASNALIYIDPREYSHEIKLWHFYYDYWFSQGTVVEAIAQAELKSIFAETAMCEGNQSADAVVWVRPRMFYNPHMTTFHGTMIVNVYSGSGRLLGNYKGEAQSLGFLDVVPAHRINEAYALAMRDVVRQMQADAPLQKVLTRGLPEHEARLSCGLIPILPPLR